jgi:single-stranded DNA-specific DHH superfamily exonuclease
MLTERQVGEIKEHLGLAQNPVFFFDNDADGLCSFLLLQRYLGRGKGVPIKSFPELTKEYFRKVRELGADYIFVLDKPLISEDFFNEVKKTNIPLVWIDHHETEEAKIPSFVNYYNPFYNKKKSNEPVTALCYQITNRKEDLWIAVSGCISDKFVPDFYPDFIKQYPNLSVNSDNAFEIYYRSEIGKISRIFGCSLMDKTTNVINMLWLLMRAKNPYEVLNEDGKNFFMHKRFQEIKNKTDRYIQEASSQITNSKLLFFKYGGTMSLSADISNELSYLFPDKLIVIAYLSGIKINISARGKKIKKILLESISDLNGATGGGHEDAVGATIKIEDLEKFKQKIQEIVNDQ